MVHTSKHFVRNTMSYTPIYRFFLIYSLHFPFWAPSLQKWCTCLLSVPNMERVSILSPPCFGDRRDGKSYGGGLACGVQSNTRILEELGPQLKDLKKGEVIILDDCFPILPLLPNIQSQRTQITQHDKPSKMMGTPSLKAVESIHLPSCTPRLHAATRAQVGYEPRGAYPMTPLDAHTQNFCVPVSILGRCA